MRKSSDKSTPAHKISWNVPGSTWMGRQGVLIVRHAQHQLDGSVSLSSADEVSSDARFGFYTFENTHNDMQIIVVRSDIAENQDYI